jgi:hypothetical protein
VPWRRWRRCRRYVAQLELDSWLGKFCSVTVTVLALVLANSLRGSGSDKSASESWTRRPWQPWLTTLHLWTTWLEPKLDHHDSMMSPVRYRQSNLGFLQPNFRARTWWFAQKSWLNFQKFSWALASRSWVKFRRDLNFHRTACSHSAADSESRLPVIIEVSLWPQEKFQSLNLHSGLPVLSSSLALRLSQCTHDYRIHSDVHTCLSLSATLSQPLCQFEKSVDWFWNLTYKLSLNLKPEAIHLIRQFKLIYSWFRVLNPVIARCKVVGL